MHLGIDLDNTIICYDGLFHRLAVERGLIDLSVPATKLAVRDAMRAADREDDWTLLQGFAYGPRITDAQPFPGVLEFLHGCQREGVAVSIVSHKTHHPYRGPAYDLHEAAWTWLTHYGITGRDDAPVSHDNVYLETSRDAKLRRIARLKPSHFVDDLPDFLTDNKFPRSVVGVLFDPNNVHGEIELRRVLCWTRTDAKGVAA